MKKSSAAYLAAALALLVVSQGLVVLKLFSVVDQLHGNVTSQVKNRAANVKSWCGGINEGRDYDRAFVRLAQRGSPHPRPYTLKDKDCKALVRHTLESAGVNPATSP